MTAKRVPGKRPPKRGRATGNRARSLARRLALQALYHFQLNPRPLAVIQKQFAADPEADRVDLDYFKALLKAIAPNREVLDAHLAGLCEIAPPELDPIEHAVLWLGLHELKSCPELPYRVVLAETVQLAKQFGATHTLLASPQDAGLLKAAEEVKALIGRGADYAFECTAVPELGAAPLAMVSNGGVAIAVSGIEQVVPINMRLFEFDKLYINPLYGQCRPSRDFPMLMSLYAQKRLKLDEMVSRTYPLSAEGLTLAFSDMQAGRIAKGVLVPARDLN